MPSQHGPANAAMQAVSIAYLICALCLLSWHALADLSPSGPEAPSSGHLQPSSTIDFEVEGVVFHNRSLGLDRSFAELGHQCSPGKPLQQQQQQQQQGNQMVYTPNRHWSDAKNGRTALVVPIGGPPEHFLKRMESAWGGWKEEFLARLAQSTSVVMLLDADYTNSTAELAASLQLIPVDCAKHQKACQTAAALDAGYTLYTAPATEAKRPIVVLVGRAAFPAPWWAARNGTTEASLIQSGWQTPHCRTPYLKTKILQWHAHHMFRQLRVLDFFDFWMRLDDTVRWASKFPGDITHHLASKHRIFFHSGLQREADLDCIGLWRQSASKPVALYIDSESNRCGRILWPAAIQQPWFSDDTQVFAAEFVGGWLGFWTAPEVLMYGLYWNSFPGGTWEYRWGNQQFWKSALGLFDDGSHVEDVSYVRSGLDPNLIAQHVPPHNYLNIMHTG